MAPYEFPAALPSNYAFWILSLHLRQKPLKKIKKKYNSVIKLSNENKLPSKMKKAFGRRKNNYNANEREKDLEFGF